MALSLVPEPLGDSTYALWLLGYGGLRIQPVMLICIGLVNQ